MSTTNPHAQQGQSLQHMVLMGRDETGNLVPIPISEGGMANSTTIVGSTIQNVEPTKMLLSGSTNGKGILITTTATAGNTIHTAVGNTTQIDFIKLFAVNSSASGVKLTIEWGQATAPDGNIEMTIPPEDGLFEVTPPDGLPLNNSLVVKAFAATGSVIVLYGHVIRSTI